MRNRIFFVGPLMVLCSWNVLFRYLRKNKNKSSSSSSTITDYIHSKNVYRYTRFLFTLCLFGSTKMPMRKKHTHFFRWHKETKSVRICEFVLHFNLHISGPAKVLGECCLFFTRISLDYAYIYSSCDNSGSGYAQYIHYTHNSFFFLMDYSTLTTTCVVRPVLCGSMV